MGGEPAAMSPPPRLQSTCLAEGVGNRMPPATTVPSTLGVTVVARGGHPKGSPAPTGRRLGLGAPMRRLSSAPSAQQERRHSPPAGATSVRTTEKDSAGLPDHGLWPHPG